jgi:hypothetical protein
MRENFTALNTAADPKLRELVERSLAAAVRTYEHMRKRGIRGRAPLDTQRQFCRLETAKQSSPAKAGNVFSLHIMALEREPNYSEVAFN